MIKLKDDFLILDYNQCAICNYISKDERMALSDFPCPNCGAKEERNGSVLWPIANLIMIYQEIMKFYGQEEKEIVIILFSVLYEGLFDDFLENLLVISGANYEIKEYIMGNLMFFPRREKLYNKPTQSKFENDCNRTVNNKFYNGLKEINVLRNKFIHEAALKIKKEDMEKTIELLGEILDFFIQVQSGGNGRP